MKLSLKIFLFAFLAAAAGACALLRAQTTQTVATSPSVPTFGYGGDVAEIPAQFTDDLVFLSARVSLSAPSLFELDSTAPTTSIAPPRASAIDRVNVAAPVLNFEGVDLPLSALPLRANDDFGARVGQTYQATLGQDFLSSLVLEIDYSRLSVRAYAPSTYKYSGKGTVFPLKLSQGMPVVPVQFALPKGKVVEADFAVNTALDASLLISNKFLAGRKMLGNRGRVVPSIDPISGAAGASLGKLRSVKMGALTPSDVLATFTDSSLPDAGDPIAGEIGASMLSRFAVIFDFPHHQLILTPNLHFPDPDQEDKSGLLIVGKGPDYKRFEVVQVEPHTPASDAGIEQGDVIAGVDAEAAADLSLLVTRDLFRQVGHKYKLVIEHQGTTKEVTLQMRRYF